MVNKQFNVILIVALVLLALFFFKGKSFATIQDTENALKQEYKTYWADSTDDNFDYGYKGSATGTPPSKLFECAISPGGIVHTSSGTNIGYYLGGCTSYKDFKGQELVVLLEAKGSTSFGSYTRRGGTLETIYFVPHTLDSNKFDVFFNGKSAPNFVTTSTIDTNTGRLNFGSDGAIYYIGYKAQFACDLTSDEVWIQEAFTNSTFSINDVAFIPTKFCKETRPFVLRDINQGETAIYPDPIPDFNRGISLSVPPDKAVIVNYATFYVSGVTNRCDVNQANTKVNGQWVCKDIIKSIEYVTVPYPSSIFDLIFQIFTEFFNFIKALFGG